MEERSASPPDEVVSRISRIREQSVLGERVALLEQAPLFSVLHPADLRTLAGKFHPVRYGKAEGIFREGELEVIDRGSRAMDARAMETSRIYAMDSDVFWTMLENRPPLARRLLELMARRLRRADQTSQDLVFFDAPTRLARRLLQLAEEHGEAFGEEEDAVRISVRVTQEEMAQMIGVTRESANRLIASFASRGWIGWNDGYPIIREPEALMRRAR
jgi:hypothetical protein